VTDLTHNFYFISSDLYSFCIYHSITHCSCTFLTFN